jgi:long-chain acyl-CoA synthetase
MNLSALPDLRAAQAPDAPAVADDNVDLNNIQFFDAVRRASATMREHGVAPGDVVAIMLPNQASFVVALFAAWRLGAVVTPISPTLVPAEVSYQLEDAAAQVLVVEKPLEFDAPVRAVVTTAELASGAAAGVAEPVQHRDDALALLIYTSGTTGRPKGVMLDHANLNAMCRMVIDAFSMTTADHSLLILPLFHVNGIVVGTLSPLIAGGRATIAGRFSPKTFFDRVEITRATYFSAVPTMYTMLSDLPADVRPDTSSVRFAVCGAAPASVELLDKFETRYGIPLIEGYGLSEGSCASTGNPLNGKRKPGTVGLPLPGQTIRIVGRRRRGCSARGGRRGSGAGAERHARLPEPPGGNRQDARRWLAAHRGRRAFRRGRLPHAGRPRQGHDHSWRREHLPQGNRDRRLPATGDRRGSGHRARAPGVRRRAGPLRLAEHRRHDHRRRDPRTRSWLALKIQAAR